MGRLWSKFSETFRISFGELVEQVKTLELILGPFENFSNLGLDPLIRR
jgi:hypothetical protein